MIVNLTLIGFHSYVGVPVMSRRFYSVSVTDKQVIYFYFMYIFFSVLLYQLADIKYVLKFFFFLNFLLYVCYVLYICLYFYFRFWSNLLNIFRLEVVGVQWEASGA